jgi:hypothetical protein
MAAFVVDSHDAVERRVQDGSFARLAVSQFLLGSLSVFDVGVDPVPFDDVARVVAQWIPPKEKPAILAIVPTHSRLGLFRRFRARGALPCRCQAWQIVISPHARLAVGQRQWDQAVTPSFTLANGQRLELRSEAIKVTNYFNP